MTAGPATFRFHGDLPDLVPRRAREVDRDVDGVSSVLHWVQTVGVPRTEVGGFRVAGRGVPPSYVVRAGDLVDVLPVALPRRPPHPPRFVCDVHLGSLARRLRLLGFDTAYANDASDPALAAQSLAESRTLLTRDLGLLRRRAVTDGAFVRGSTAGDQLRDVVRQFALAPRPPTRCTTCNGELLRVPKAEIADRLQAGTRRSYDDFARCADCGRVYWRGAHAPGIAAALDGIG